MKEEVDFRHAHKLQQFWLRNHNNLILGLLAVLIASALCPSPIRRNWLGPAKMLLSHSWYYDKRSEGKGVSPGSTRSTRVQALGAEIGGRALAADRVRLRWGHRREAQIYLAGH